MTNVRGRNARLGVDFGLEREQAEDVVNSLGDRFDAPGTPRPDRRADEVHHRHTRLPHGDLDVEIEVRRIDADEGQRRIGQQILLESFADSEDLTQLAKHFHVAVDRQLVHRPIGLEALLGHARAADAVVGNIGGQLLCVQPLEQQRGQ